MAQSAVTRAKAKTGSDDELEAFLEIHSQVLSNVSHEFRSALTAVQGYTKRVLEERSGAINDLVRADLAVVLKNIRSLLDLAGYSLPFIAEQRLHLEALDIRDLWHHVVKRISHRLSDKGITLREQLPSEPIVIHADQSRLETALEILLTNAMGCSGAGSEISVVMTLGMGGDVRVKIAATGTTLPSYSLEGVFEHKETNPNRHPFSGLPLAHDLVWLHGGRLAVKSTVAEGTVFVATFPTRPEEHPGS